MRLRASWARAGCLAAWIALATPSGCASSPRNGDAALGPPAGRPTRPPATPPPPIAEADAPQPALPAEETASVGPPPENIPSPTAEPTAPNEHPRIVLVDEGPHYVVHLREAEDVPPDRIKTHGRHGRPYHPAPGIVVDVVDARGPAPAADLQRVARSAGYWPFRRCYEEGLRRDQALAGKVFLQVRVSANGAVERSDLARWTLGDESVAACVAREARHLAFFVADAPTDAVVTITLATGDEPVPVARPIADAGRVRQALRASWPAVEECYAAALDGRPDTGGRMELRFRIAPSGEVADVAEGGSGRFPDADVTRCVLRAIRTASLPALGPSLIGHASVAALLQERAFVYVLHLESIRSPSAQP